MKLTDSKTPVNKIILIEYNLSHNCHTWNSKDIEILN